MFGLVVESSRPATIAQMYLIQSRAFTQYSQQWLSVWYCLKAFSYADSDVMQGQLTSVMMCDPPERLQFGFQKAEVPATTNTVDRQCSLVHPETYFVNPLLASHADGVKSYRRRCQSQRGRPTPDALGSRGSLCGHVMSLGMCGLGRQRSGPSSQRFPLVSARNP